MAGSWGLFILVSFGVVHFTWNSAVNYTERTTEPGFPQHANTDDPGVKKAAKFAVYDYNNRSNDIFVFKILDIDKAMVQVVKGLKYMLNARIGRTVCRKNEHYKLKNCEFQTDKTLKMILNCYFEVWIVSWMNMVKVPVVLCQE
ncbi:cystatin-F [Microcaecilia unicolor]|uniref:Cystatin-F n=1 Tax=Microcaecilia unicolor TaxID=1415580 RepID=A0A6P7X517_9AMPH|nr:cystatin-F [Microcaecilia unicolor]